MHMKANPINFVGITEEVLRKAARIIDEVGYVSMFRQGAGYKLAVRVWETELKNIPFLEEHFGGYYNEQVMENGTRYWLNLQQKRGFMFLKAIYPYLEKKNAHADLVFRLYGMIEANKRKRISDEERKTREDIIALFKTMNRTTRI